mgnify:CR=1 FL=1
MKSIQVIASLLCGILYCGISLNAQNVLKATGWMPEHTFTSGIEGPAVDSEGNLYAVNYKKEGTIGIVRPDGSHGCFLVLPEGSTGNSIRFGKDGNMYVADYTGHNILKVDMKSKKISVFAHEPKMNQPNDIVFASNGNIYASDPDWPNQKGQLWLITPDAKVSLLETNMGTTNGIAVSEDGKRLYINESAQLKVWVYDKGTIALLNPQGDLVEEIQLTGKQPSNLTFGGPDHRQCYVTLQDRGCFETFKVPYPGKEW